MSEMTEQQRIITWTRVLKKMPYLFLGFNCFALGILLTRDAGLGMAPWGVFHMGMANILPMTMGQATQLMGLVILTVAFFLGSVPGLASIMNMIFIGMFIDLWDQWISIPVPSSILLSIGMILFGVFLIGWGTYFYLKVELGAGPRDGLMEGLIRKTEKPVWLIRGLIEGSALFIGYLMGGPVGAGTVIIASTLGFSVAFAFRVGKYDSLKADHVNIIQLYRGIRNPHYEILHETKK